MARRPFAQNEVPVFPEAPAVVLITGDVEFFVEEAAARAAANLAGDDAEVLRFEEDAAAEAVSDALLNRSLFSARRLVRFDVSRLLGSESPAKLAEQAVAAWEKGTPAGRREAFLRARALLSALDLPGGAPAEALAEEAARKTRRKALQDPLASILRELPEERGGGPGIVKDAIRHLLQRGNDGTVALVTATDPPAGVDLMEEIARKGLVLTASVGDDPGPALTRLARALAKEREVSLDPDAVARLLHQTDSNPPLFAAELAKLLEWAGPGGRVRAADVRENVEDESSEDLYGFYDALGRRDAGDALGRLERILSGRTVRAGEREYRDEDYWEVRFLGMLAEEIRRMLLIRARMEEEGSPPDVSLTFNAFKARILPRLEEPVPPFGRSPFRNRQGQISPFLWFKAAVRAARYSTPELARALARAADVDVRLKSSVPPLDALSVYVAELIAGT
jgi:DNA polymerase III delta subunit